MRLPTDLGAGARLEELHGNNIYMGGAHKARRKSKTNHGRAANDIFLIDSTRDTQTEAKNHNAHNKYLSTATTTLRRSFLGHLEWRMSVSNLNTEGPIHHNPWLGSSQNLRMSTVLKLGV